jgi:glycerophosphoryl diester phosphodiesterase
MSTLVIAHRGASGEVPENTIAAFDLARTQGSDMIELDVRPIADQTIITFHDDTTERWNGRPDAIPTLSPEAFRNLRVDGEPVPTFEEVCQWTRETGMRLNVELKGTGFEQAVVDLIRRYDLVDQIIVSSFYEQALLTLRVIAPELRRGALMGVRSWNPRIRVREAWPFRALRRVEAVAWHPAWQLPLIPRLLPLVRRRGYQVNVWTVDDPTTMRDLIRVGADGIITNYPARLRQILAAASGDATG